jgi:PAS domain S-box-containing protein
MPDVLRDAVILSVHDDPAGREAARRALQRVGCTVLEAANGLEALAIAAREPVDLILLDVDLPGMDGFEVVRRLKADPATAAIPVLYLSATPVDPDSVIRGLEGGADGYLTEPASPEVLISTVRALLRMRRATQEAEQLAQQRQEALARLQSTYEELETANEELAAAHEELQTSHDEIEQQRAFFAAVLEQVPVGIIIGQDPSGEVVTTNEAGQAIYEVAPGENLSAFAPPDQRARHRYYQEGRELSGDELPMRQAIVQDRVLRDVEIEMRSASGRHRWLRVNAAPVHDAQRRTIGSVGVTWDITEQRRAQEALRESEARYRRLHDTMLQGVVYQAADGRILSMNPAAVRILGKTPEEFLGQTSVSVEHDTVREDGTPFPGVEHPAMVALRTGEPVQGVVMGVYNPRRKERRWISIDAIPMFRGGEARPYQVYTIFADITERRQAAEERERLQAELLAAERARAALAEGLNREIAHRTKNNLAMAAGLLQLQMYQQRDARVRTALSATMSRLMAFASIQEELQAVTAAGWIDLLPVLERVSSASAGAFAGGEAVVSVSGERVPLPSKAATNLAVVTNELVTNALKHGAAGSDGKLHVDVVVEPAHDSIRLRVWNSGNPVSEGFDTAAMRGLGLQLVRDLIVAQYHGAFHLRAERGGSLAEVTVPRAELQQE